MSIKSKEEGKCQESIQLVPHLTQNTLWKSDKRTRKRHIQKRLKLSSDSGPSPCISKWSDGGNHRVPKARKGGEHEMGIIPPYRYGVSPEIYPKLCPLLQDGFYTRLFEVKINYRKKIYHYLGITEIQLCVNNAWIV